MKEQVVGHYASHQHGLVRRRPLPGGLLPPPAPPTRPVPRRSEVRGTKEFLDAFYSGLSMRFRPTELPCKEKCSGHE